MEVGKIDGGLQATAGRMARRCLPRCTRASAECARSATRDEMRRLCASVIHSVSARRIRSYLQAETARSTRCVSSHPAAPQRSRPQAPAKCARCADASHGGELSRFAWKRTEGTAGQTYALGTMCGPAGGVPPAVTVWTDVSTGVEYLGVTREGRQACAFRAPVEPPGVASTPPPPSPPSQQLTAKPLHPQPPPLLLP